MGPDPQWTPGKRALEEQQALRMLICNHFSKLHLTYQDSLHTRPYIAKLLFFENMKHHLTIQKEFI